jgi:tight adherence protein B
MSVLVGAFLALAVVTAAGTGGRRVGRSAQGRQADRPPRVGASPHLSAVLLGVCAQLRAGAAPGEAWSRATGSAPVGPVPTAGDLLRATTRPARWPSRARDGDAAQRVRAVLAAARLSDELGAPLAGVLERIASAVAADEEAEGERRAALAGPRSTAQVLAWLPVLGVGLGALLGADPVAVMLYGWLGTVSALLGVSLLLLGRWWTAALLARAGRAGDDRQGAPRPGSSRGVGPRPGARRAGFSGPVSLRPGAGRTRPVSGIPRPGGSRAAIDRTPAVHARP